MGARGLGALAVGGFPRNLDGRQTQNYTLRIGETDSADQNAPAVRVLDFTVPEAVWNHHGQYSEREYRYLRSARNANIIGFAKTHELLIGFHDTPDLDVMKTMADGWQNAPVCMADPAWMCASGVFGRWHPVDTDRFPEVEKKLSKAWDAERRLEAYTRDYGMFNLGDGHTVWKLDLKRWADVYRC